jgi:phospholipid methyltransferase
MREWTRRVARARVPLGFVGGAAALWLAGPDCRSLALGGAIAAIGEGLRIWAAGHLEKGREVTSSGPYHHLAHPLYIGSAIMGGGLAVASRSIAVAVIIAVYLAVTLAAAVRTEDAFLREKFGDRYEAWRASGVGSSPRRFEFARAMRNREYRAALGVVAVMAFLAWKAGCR